LVGLGEGRMYAARNGGPVAELVAKGQNIVDQGEFALHYPVKTIRGMRVL